MFRKDRFKFHSSAENEVEVITLTSYRCKLTIIGAYVTTSNHIKANKEGNELLRMAALRQISREVTAARARGHSIALIGDLNLRPSEEQLKVLDGHLRSMRTPGFNFSVGFSREIFAIVKEWNLVLQNGLYTKAGLKIRQRGS